MHIEIIHRQVQVHQGGGKDVKTIIPESLMKLPLSQDIAFLHRAMKITPDVFFGFQRNCLLLHMLIGFLYFRLLYRYLKL